MLQILIFASLGLIAMLTEIFNIKKTVPYIVFFGTISAIVLSILNWDINTSWFNHMVTDDIFSRPFILIACIIFLLWVLIFYGRIMIYSKIVEYYALLCFAMVGGLVLLSFSNLAMLFLGVEILSIPVYILVGSRKKNLKSNEASFKYFLMGAFASGILLFGITFIYGATGSFDTAEIAHIVSNYGLDDLPVFFKVGMLLIVFALSFKVSAMPFHFWTPDVYEGSPTPFTAFMATLVKTFAIGAFFRLFNQFFGNDAYIYSHTLIALSLVTMILGNLLGAVQDNPKRLLAYSSISHAGFMLVAVYVGGLHGAESLLYYVSAYSVASLLAFFVFDKVIMKDDFYKSIGDFAGLYKRSPLLAFGLTVALFSMAGIPPFSGFFAKYFIFNAAFVAGHASIVIVGIVASILGVYYYFKFIRSMYAKGKQTHVGSNLRLKLTDKLIVLFLVALVIGLGLMPDFILDLLT
jgi:NADH-quinone oxidoreductase subunit N